MPLIDPDEYRVRPGAAIRLRDIRSRQDGDLAEEAAIEATVSLQRRLGALQELMYAEGKHALLVVLQAMDAAGKDSTIRRVFGRVNPQGCRVASFKVPTELQRRHDFLWRIHDKVPPQGMMTIFNRSHYEDVLVVRVLKLAPPGVWKKRYEHINAFERLLGDSNVTILKFYLHVSKAYQKERLQRRLDRPDKLWKFNPGDLPIRRKWSSFMKAYEDVFAQCSTKNAPWFIVPSERRWYRDLVITQTVVDTLERLRMQHPPVTFDPTSITID